MKTEQTPEKNSATPRGRAAPKCAAATPPPARRYKSSEPEPAAEGSHTEGALAGALHDCYSTPVKEESPETRRSEYPTKQFRYDLFRYYSVKKGIDQ